MDDLTLQVRQIMLDLEKKKEDKDSKKTLQETLNSNGFVAVICSCLAWGNGVSRPICAEVGAKRVY